MGASRNQGFYKAKCSDSSNKKTDISTDDSQTIDPSSSEAKKNHIDSSGNETDRKARSSKVQEHTSL